MLLLLLRPLALFTKPAQAPHRPKIKQCGGPAPKPACTSGLMAAVASSSSSSYVESEGYTITKSPKLSPSPRYCTGDYRLRAQPKMHANVTCVPRIGPAHTHASHACRMGTKGGGLALPSTQPLPAAPSTRKNAAPRCTATAGRLTCAHSSTRTRAADPCCGPTTTHPPQFKYRYTYIHSSVSSSHGVQPSQCASANGLARLGCRRRK